MPHHPPCILFHTDVHLILLALSRLAKVPHSLFFLGIHRNHGLSRLLKGPSLIMNPWELIVPIRMVDGSFVDFPRAL